MKCRGFARIEETVAQMEQTTKERESTEELNRKFEGNEGYRAPCVCRRKQSRMFCSNHSCS